MKKSKLRVVILGAGFGGLEVASILSERIGEQLDLTIIDQNDSFYFGFSKLDVMFGRKTGKSVKIPFANIKKPGVQFCQDSITSIDPETRTITTEKKSYTADILVIALGADYDLSITPGLLEGGNEFYSLEGAKVIRDLLPGITGGDLVIGVASSPIKCPPAPCEAALLLHDYLFNQGVRNNCSISLVVPYEVPIPPSYGTSKALLKAFDQRNIRFIPNMMVESIDPGKKVANLYDGTDLPFDLFLGIPEHCVPEVVENSGMTVDDWIPVNKKNLKTRYPGVYAIGDVTSVGTPKAGMFAESAGKIAAESIIADFYDQDYPGAFDGKGSCYIEFGGGKVGRADVDFFSGPYSTGTHHEATKKLSLEKQAYFLERKARWFGK